ncbi:hypothetical protein NCS52_01202300 [Fusarium sp. LHS14.1]|nr:hypothetical protein NCS52_01202300 [Fusarium sp. LHS14.1]
MGPLAPRTVFIIEVDPDFSVGFFLALYAAVEFSLSVTEEQPQAVMRLATMSWEPADELYSRMVQQTGHRITTIAIPSSFEFYHCLHVGSGEEEPFQAIISRLHRLGSDDLHTVVYFQDVYAPPPRWEEDEWERWGWTRDLFEVDDLGRFPVQDEQTSSVILHVPCGTRGSDRLEVNGYAHIIPSRIRRRLIFDMQTMQVVEVDLRVSQSERSQQLSWVDRTTCPRSRMCVYLDVQSQMRQFRRKDILNGQAAGLIAGLAQFEGWPRRIRSLPRLIALLAQGDETIKGILDQTVQRLELQGLLRMEEPAMGPVISLRGGIPNTFWRILPPLNYDTRLAYLLVRPSDPKTTWLKIQLAAAMSIGRESLVTVGIWKCTEVDLSFIKIARDFGYGAKLAPFGTLWMVLGLLKGGKSDVIHRHNYRPFVDEKVIVDYETLQVWERRCSTLHNILSPGQPRVDVLDETKTLTEDQVESLHLDCLRAFAFQIAVVTFPNNSRRPVAHDFVSGVKLGLDTAIVATIDWDTINKNDPECMVGFYTTVERSKSFQETTIRDWHWIPSSIWRRWRQSLEVDGPDNWALMANRYDLSRNSDEFEYQ